MKKPKHVPHPIANAIWNQVSSLKLCIMLIIFSNRINKLNHLFFARCHDNNSNKNYRSHQNHVYWHCVGSWQAISELNIYSNWVQLNNAGIIPTRSPGSLSGTLHFWYVIELYSYLINNNQIGINSCFVDYLPQLVYQCNCLQQYTLG